MPIVAPSAVPQETSWETKIKNDRGAKALWWLMMALRVVIPGYMLYLVYLYWTTPVPDYLQHPY
jgi:hypothetical protein